MIQVDDEAQIAISNTTVGTYLYVEVYLMVQETLAIFAALSAMTDNVFKQQRRHAMFEAAAAATESAFQKLGLKASNSGYKRNKNSVKSES